MKEFLKVISRWAAWLGTGVMCIGAAPDSLIHFNRDVRPILAEHCLACHGPDKAARKGKFRLDQREEAIRKAITPGKSSESLLIKKVSSSNPDEMMPPPDSKKARLSAEEIKVLSGWIDAGATWEAHWAYMPVARPAVPERVNPEWPVHNPIDNFVQARLRKEGLQPSAEADRRTLLRRLSFDLTGLPPESGVGERFLRGDSPMAYDELVERLMASPHFGERLAIYWLDLVRYADTDGFHADNYRSVYPYRDYVIEAFNENMPFDQFTIEQVAGDLLPHATVRQKIASTYNRLNRTTEEGGSQPKEYLAKYAADRVRTTSTVWMGSTMACCECHDHKFDPFTTRDFYSLEAFSADIKEQGVGKPEEVPVPSASQQRELEGYDQKIAALEGQLRSSSPKIAEAQRVWEEEMRGEMSAGEFGWKRGKLVELSSKNGTQLALEPDGSILGAGPNPDKEEYEAMIESEQPQVTAVRLEALTDPSMDKQSLSRGGGNFVLTEIEVSVASGRDAAFHPVRLVRAAADYSQPNFPVSAAIDGKPETGWAVDGQTKVEARKAAFYFAEPVTGGPGTLVQVRLKHESRFAKHQIGRFRLSLTSLARADLSDDGVPEGVARGLKKLIGERTAEDAQAVAEYYRSISPLLDSVRAEEEELKKQKAALERELPRSLVTVAVEPRTIRVLPRGNWMNDSGEVVAPAVPQFLPHEAINGRRATRLDLARWLVARENPLAARVFVNRLWKLYFGTGLSKNVDDLGAQGEWPVEAELLDWLASEFMASGWNVKHMIELIVESHTYRQSSEPTDETTAKDPFNRLLARQSRFRLDAELIRDNALAVSGMLTDRIGGPSVKPYQPEGFWMHLNFPKRTYEHDHGANEYRRGLYTFWCRTFTHPSLVAFDAPGREECVANRTASNTPLQALVLLNDPTYVEAARVLGELMAKQGAAEAAQGIRWGYYKVLQRGPTEAEAKVLGDLYASERAEYASNPAAAEGILRVGEWPSPTGAPAAELASWTAVARVLLNLNETIVRY